MNDARMRHSIDTRLTGNRNSVPDYTLDGVLWSVHGLMVDVNVIPLSSSLYAAVLLFSGFIYRLVGSLEPFDCTSPPVSPFF